MNKNYSNILMATVICLAAYNGSFGFETPGKGCFETDNNSLRKIAQNYILSYFALYAAIPAVSAGFIKAVGSGLLRNSSGPLKNMSLGLAIKLTKTIPVTASLVAVYAGLQINKNINE